MKRIPIEEYLELNSEAKIKALLIGILKHLLKGNTIIVELDDQGNLKDVISE